MTRITRLILPLLLLPVFTLAAQWEMEPLDLRDKSWKVIRSEHYDVIFPAELEKQGRYVADSLEYLFPLQRKSLKPDRNHRFPIILYPDYMGSNGYVSWMPRRSVFFTTPSSRFSGDWISTLSVHEGRHTAQLDAFDRNTVGFFYVLYGELALYMGMPAWWLEGDAVLAETLLTDTGRGRDPGFTAEFKALMLDNRLFEYNKMMLGSEKDYIPDHYTFGYLMQCWLRTHYDPNLPETLAQTWSRVPIPLIGPSLAVKKASGKVPRKIYREMAEGYAKFWKEQIADLPITPIEHIIPGDARHYTRHDQLAFLSDGSAVVSLFDIKRGNSIIHYSKEGTHKKNIPGGVPQNSLTAGGSLVAWDELILDAKYESARSRIVILDTQTNRREILTGEGRYLSPALSRDGTRLALVQWEKDYTSRLLIFDTETLEQVSESPIPDGRFWCDLSWSSDGKTLLLIENGSGGRRIRRHDPMTQKTLTLVDGKNENLSSPVEWNGSVVFVSDYSGIPSLYLLDQNNRRYQVTVRPLSSTEPAYNPATGTIGFIDYTDSLGTDIATMPENRIPQEQVVLVREDFFKPHESSEPGSGAYTRDQVPEGNTPIEDYRFGLSGNRLHSWGISPLVGDIPSDPAVGIFAVIDNIAGTANQQINLDYWFNEPALSLGYTLTWRKYRPDLSVKTTTLMRDLTGEPFNETRAGLGVNLPFGEFIKGGAFWTLNPGTGISGAGRFSLNNEDPEYILAVNHSLSGSVGYERWLASASAGFQWQPFTDDFRYQLNIMAVIRTPGLFAKDSLTLTGYYEKQNSENLSAIPFARGWDPVEAEHTVMGSADYRFPLFYPDLAAGGLAYCHRITGAVFYDYTRILDLNEGYSSTGAEIKVHFYPLQLPFDLDVGFRFAWQIETSQPRFELLLVGIPVGLN